MGFISMLFATKTTQLRPKDKRVRQKIITAMCAALIGFTGCSDIFGPDKEGWLPSQKKAFLTFLQNDPYLSLCELKPLLQQAKQTQDSKLYTRLLIGYANNLANSCIDLKHFEQEQEKLKQKKIKTHYGYTLESVDHTLLLNRLKAKMSFETIFAPYKPKWRQFDQLITVYKNAKTYKLSSQDLHKVRISIERIKLLPKDLGRDYVLINIPSFMVRLYEEDVLRLKFKTVVGKYSWQTPIFSAPLRYIMINPQWNVPDSIARESIIKRYLKGGKAYLDARGMTVRKGYDLNAPEVDPSSVNWGKYLDSKGYIPYKFIQKPSRKNGLGRVKFMFPNRFAVYMHDTQAKSLFRKKRRTYSHGCIRLEKPVTLLEHLARHYSDRSYDEVKRWYDSLKTHTLRINKPLQVHIVYLTAWVDDEAKLHLYDDIYGFDARQKIKGD